MIGIAGMYGWEWLVLGCVTVIPQNLLWSLLLDPLISYSLCLVFGHISDLALKLSLSMAHKVLAYL